MPEKVEQVKRSEIVTDQCFKTNNENVWIVNLILKKSFRSSESRTDFSWYIAEEINKSSNTLQ